jgi:hypothetical protein
MYCLNGTSGHDDQNANEPVNPLYQVRNSFSSFLFNKVKRVDFQLTRKDWWFHHVNKVRTFLSPQSFLAKTRKKNFSITVRPVPPGTRRLPRTVHENKILNHCEPTQIINTDQPTANSQSNMRPTAPLRHCHITGNILVYLLTVEITQVWVSRYLAKCQPVSPTPIVSFF